MAAAPYLRFKPSDAGGYTRPMVNPGVTPYGGSSLNYPVAPSNPYGQPAAPGEFATGARTVTTTTEPNYLSLLRSDYGLQQQRLANANELAQQNLGYTAQRGAAINAYGAAPDAPLTQSTLEAASANHPLSVLAGLLRGYQGGQAASAEGLAARGILHSGAYLAHSNANLRDLGLGQAQAQQNLLGTLAGISQQQTAAQADAAKSNAQATSDALGRIVDQVNAGTIAPVTRTRRVAAPVSPTVRRNL